VAPGGNGMTLIVAIVGAESTGKTELAEALAPRLAGEFGLRCTWVAEYLREWCIRERCTPREHEQAAIADEQRRRIEEAARTHDVVIADTTPLMTAVYSEFVFGDCSLYAGTLGWQRDRAALTLVTGLDVPWRPDGVQRDGPHVRVPVDRLLRSALASAGLAYGVVYGNRGARIDAALRAVNKVLAG
jgi:nicotinamide riboside kinase